MSIPYGSLAVTVDLGAVVACAAHALGETTEALTGPSRKRELSRHRQVAMAAARRLGHSYPSIARAFGREDHSTVRHAVQRVEARPELAERARIIADEISTPRSLF